MESIGKVETVSERLTKIFMGLTIFGLVGSAISTFFKVDPGVIAPITTVLIVLSGATIVALGIRNWGAISALLIVCGLSEVFGVLTGFPFGRYEYTDRWWPTVPLGEHHRYPLLIPFAWLLIIGSSYGILRSRFSKWPSVLMTALLATFIDMPMERAMTDVFGYWNWNPAGPLFGAPIQNSIGWIAVSLIAASILTIRETKIEAISSSKVLAVFCIFVASCGGLHGPDLAWVLLFVASFVSIWLYKPNQQ